VSIAQDAVITFLALFPIVNPFGAIPLFSSLTAGIAPTEVRSLSRQIAGYVVGILLVFLLLGGFVLEFFGISLAVIEIAGGLLVANTAWGMATGTSRITADEHREAAARADIAFSPMAMPLLSGPGAIGVVMTLPAHAPPTIVAYIGYCIGVVAIGVVVYLFLELGGPLVNRLGGGAVAAITRIFGFLILAIAVQLIANGVGDLHYFKAA